MSTSSDIVKLNVGGVLYSTTKSTLCKYPNSMLGAMFNGCMSTTVDENGCYFIDRDGELFRYILNYIRSSRLLLPTDFKELDLLSAEADFYQISQLIEVIETVKPPVVDKCGKTCYLEVIEVRTVVLDNISTIKTLISGGASIIKKYISSQQMPPAEQERLEWNYWMDYTEIALTGSNVRLQVEEGLRNQGWELSKSRMSTVSSGEGFTLLHKDRWCITLPI